MDKTYPTRVYKKLEKLGNTPDEIAENLRKENIKGSAMSPSSCPIATYLNTHSKTYNFSVGLTSFSIKDQNFHIIQAANAVPAAVREFVSKFDNGYYPDLKG